MLHKGYAKLFFDLGKAKEFSQEVVKMAEETKVPCGKKGQLKYSLLHSLGSGDGYTDTQDKFELIEDGKFYRIEKVNKQQNRYHVRYAISEPQGAKRADMLLAQRKLDTYLNQKHAELEPNATLQRG